MKTIDTAKMQSLQNYFSGPLLRESTYNANSFSNDFSSLRFTVIRVNDNLLLLVGMKFSNCQKCNRLIIQNQTDKENTFCDICYTVKPNFILM
jgi:hypothetical protein